MNCFRIGGPGRLAFAAASLTLLLVLSVGCPHRSPVWSPDGRRILLLAGEKGEALDKAASQLWLVDSRTGKTRRLSLPEPASRVLAATWLSEREFVVLTGKWDEDYVESGTERVWRSDGTTWKRLDVPAPNEARATRRLPVVLSVNGAKALAYPTGDEEITVVSLGDGSILKKLEPAELIGPGPDGGFLVYRPEESDTGGSELAAFGASLELLWTQSFTALRAAIAGNLGKKPIEIVFNEASTSHVPHPGDTPERIGVTMAFSDVSWREGITAYYTQLDAKTGKLLTAVEAVGISGQPSATKGALWTVLAPEPRKELPERVASLDLDSRKPLRSIRISSGAVHGYALSPSGDRFAVSVNDTPCRLQIFDLKDPKKVKTFELEAR